ncbi:DUF1302 domain-containing protein [Paraburkholderia phytofirmans]|uniref:DUF1302 domain-containing protein n=1 Tax=Paraburkholderia phytofirmans TaxID=261302 RepID=UPI0038BD8080
MQTRHHPAIPPQKLAVMVSLALTAFSAHAFEIQTPNPDLEMHWDNTVSYNGGWRVQGQNPAILNNPQFSESDNKFGKGDMFQNRADILSEFDLIYKDKYGFRLSGEGWYDNAYHDTSTGLAPGPTSVGIPSAYNNGQYSSYIKKYYRGPGGQLLDAFVFGTFNAGTVPISVRLGQTSVYWGEALFNTSNSVAYSQGPIDLNKAITSPGAKINQLFLPVSQLSATAQVTPSLSLAGQYFLDWMPNRFPEGGTYFGTAGFLFNGPNRLFTGNPLEPFLQNQPALKPSYQGNFGVNARWKPEWLGDGTLGLYFRRLAETTPYQAPLITSSGYRLVYNDDVKLYGVSLSKSIGDVSVGSELNYRTHTALVNVGINPETNQGPIGDVINGLVNATYILPRSPLWSTGTLAAELVYQHLQHISANPDLYNGVGSLACTGGGLSTGCATRNALGLTVNFAPQYLQVLPGVDLTIPMTVTAGLAGNGATSGSSSAHSWTWQIGATASIWQKYTVGLYYGGFYSHYKQTSATAYPIATTAGNGPYMYNDRGYVLLTLQATF